MIRKATRDDVTMIYQAHVSSIRELCSGRYTPAQIHAWTQDLAPERYIHGIENFEFYVAEDGEGLISGLLIFNEAIGEVYAIYIAPWAVHKGFGRCLMEFAQRMIKDRGHRKISLKSTLNAVPFYEHLGFECTGEAVHTLPGGETLPCMQMTKQIV